MITYRLHLIRHGIAVGNEEGRYMGQREDDPLSQDGKKQLERLREEFTYPPVQKLYVSPLLRCTQTADILYPDTWQQALEELKEFDFGNFGGKNIRELKDNPEFLKFIEGKTEDGRAPGGESTKEFNERCKRAVRIIFEDMMKNKITDVGVVTHGGVIMSMLSQLSLPRQNYYDWAVENGTGYTVLMTPAMWLRDEGVEVYHKIPYRIIEEEKGNTALE